MIRPKTDAVQPLNPFFWLRLQILTVIDEFTRESLGTVVRRRFTSLDVIEVLSELFIIRGLHRQDDVAEVMQESIDDHGNTYHFHELF